jgi:O-antigen ligase
MTLDRLGYVLIAASLGLIQFSILAGQGVLFTLAALVWLVVVLQERRWTRLPAFALPLGVYAILTLVSAAFSGDPRASVVDSRQLLLFLMVPIVMRFATGERAAKVIDVIIAIGAAGAIVGIVQFAVLGYDNLDARPRGMLGLYMTYSGVLMLVTCATVARLLFGQGRVIWPMVALPALVVALVVTNTRNAWIGTFLAVSLLLAIRNWKLVVVAPVAAILALVLAPGLVQSRARSILDANNPANRDRMVMWKIGRDIIRDHPIVGPEQIDRNYARYRQAYPEAVNERNPHLHNVPIQIAAERGIPALVAWLWFFAAALWGLWRQLRARVAPDLAAAGLAALVAMLTAGLFEYNFGDSEFLMLFLGLITLPFAAANDVGRRGPSLRRPASPHASPDAASPWSAT